MGQMWFVGDPHLGHRLVSGLRGFATPEEHDQALMATFAECFSDGDEVFWLGDIAFAGWQQRIQQIRDLPGTHRLIVGNHDRCFAGMPRAFTYQRRFLEVFDSVTEFARVSFGGIGFRLSHFPYSGDHTEPDREAQWRLRDLGAPLIHGHTHSSARFSLSVLGTPQICVCLEAWDLRPVTLAEVVETLRAGTDGVSTNS
ncbi:MAG: metallophosphoesterase [Bifidobacteriaceae bacterium]|jgi:calcineurin-like phosphoesterase family protein|nr:metallophosphoesterase [Bifidobacteriaceae bacterium]